MRNFPFVIADVKKKHAEGVFSAQTAWEVCCCCNHFEELYSVGDAFTEGMEVFETVEYNQFRSFAS